MYLFAKALASRGHEVMFIRDRSGLFGFSQPVWEDARFTLGYEELWQTYQWTWPQWTELERRLGWQPPSWLADPFDHPTQSSPSIRSAFSAIDTRLLHEIGTGYTHWPATIELMKQCDALLVCGIESEILALASDRPFGVWTHGGDLRTASGLHPPQTKKWRDWRYYMMRQRLLRLAFQRTLFIGSYDPDGLGGHIGRIPSRYRISQVNIPMEPHARQPKAERRKQLARVMAEIGSTAPDADYVVFVPSRVDFYWKGIDRFLRGLAQIGFDSRLHVIVSGWGRDYEAAKTMVPEGSVTFLPHALSKPVLYDLFESVDLVVDQFLMGGYGTSALEAMSCGAAVLMWFNAAPVLKAGWSVPPVLNAHTDDEIAAILRQILDGQIDLEACGMDLQRWQQRVHGTDAVVPDLVERLERGARLRGSAH
jgi:glycosyltransferase involved in cell wall biosynthesis